VFFGHQSVGRDIVEGMRRLVDREPELGIRLVSTDRPEQIAGAAFMEARIGKNRHPESKADAFAEILRRGFGDEPGACAMLKYCYVDLRAGSDPQALLRDYVARVDSLRKRHPSLAIVHWTIPLKTAPKGLEERIKTAMGRSTETASNAVRAEYNALLTREYQGTDPIFDVARVQSTRPDGSRAWSASGGKHIPMLAPEWTTDGGHLNEVGQCHVATELLDFLCAVPPSPSAAG
jgi:hypothetical protein